MADPTDFQRAIMLVVGRGIGGFCVADIASLIGRQPGHDSTRAHSALVSRECLAMERAGLLVRLDDQKPIAWLAAPSPPVGETPAQADGGAV